MEFADVFKKNYLVSGLSEATIEEIAGFAEYGCKLAGEVLMDKGEKSSDLFVILDGTVFIYTDKGDKLAECGPASVLGEVALVDAGPRSAVAVCKGKVAYARFPSKELRAYMTANKDAGFVMLANLSRVLTMRLRTTNAGLESLRDKTSDPWENSI